MPADPYIFAAHVFRVIAVVLGLAGLAGGAWLVWAEWLAPMNSTRCRTGGSTVAAQWADPGALALQNAGRTGPASAEESAGAQLSTPTPHGLSA